MSSNVEKWFIVSLTDKAFIALYNNNRNEPTWAIVDSPELAFRYSGGNFVANGLTISRLAEKFGGKIMKLTFSTTVALEDLGK